MSVMYAKAMDAVKKYNMLFKGAKIVVGVSGGADSIALLLFLCSLRAEYKIEIFAVHINHGIRGSEAYYDQKFVEDICLKLNVEFTVKQYDVKKISNENNQSEEETGRIIRYKEFENERIKRNADFIAVAHNMNDQAETIIMRICRGSGLTGLSGIRAVRGNIIRPLINCFRNDIEDYLKENNQTYRTDSTNFEEKYTRNRIRLKILPMLTKCINTSAIENIAKSALLLRQEDDFLNNMAKKSLYDITISKYKNSISINAYKLLEFDIVLQRRIVRLGLIELKKDIKDIYLKHVDFVLDIAKKGGHVDMPLGFKADMSCGELRLYNGVESVNDFFYELCIDKPVFLKECGMYIEISEKNEPKKYKYLYTKAFNYDKISANVIVRNRKNGDRIVVNNNGGYKKLKSLFIDKKIPKYERDHIPIITCDNEIISVPNIKDNPLFIYNKYNNDKVLYINMWRSTDD